jgi:hypothetical protein
MQINKQERQMKHIKEYSQFVNEPKLPDSFKDEKASKGLKQQYADHRMEYAGEDVSKELGL